MFKLFGMFLQKIIDLLGGLLDIIITVLPSSPFTYIDSASAEIQNLLAGINFFIPIYSFIPILQSWIIAVALYYLYSIWARWAKAIQ